jgi:hypothetical protein
MMATPHYPEIEVRTASSNPYALIAAVREALRRAHVESREIERFTRQALERGDPDTSRSVCRNWVRVADDE